MPGSTGALRLPLLTVCLLLLSGHTSRAEENAVTGKAPRNWLKLPKNVPKSIRSQASLDAFMDERDFIAPILGGDMGDVMFQLAATHTLARQLSRPCLVGWWDQLDTEYLAAHPYYTQLPAPSPNITLKHIFPNIRFVAFLPATLHVHDQELCYCLDPSDLAFKPFPDSVIQGDLEFIGGRFLHPDCSSARLIS